MPTATTISSSASASASASATTATTATTTTSRGHHYWQSDVLDTFGIIPTLFDSKTFYERLMDAVGAQRNSNDNNNNTSNNNNGKPPTMVDFRGRRILDWIDTTRYQRPFEGVAYLASDGTAYIEAPDDWEVYRHPNGDIYYYNRKLRLLTPDDITSTKRLSRVMDHYEDHMENMQYDKIGKRMKNDWELILSDATKSSVVIEMICRLTGKAYKWTDSRGLELFESKAHYWSILAEYPSHHPRLPPGIEDEFVKTVRAARDAVDKGHRCTLSREQLDKVLERYKELKDLQAAGQNAIPALMWLMGVVMPLDYAGST